MKVHVLVLSSFFICQLHAMMLTCPFLLSKAALGRHAFCLCHISVAWRGEGAMVLVFAKILSMAGFGRHVF